MATKNISLKDLRETNNEDVNLVEQEETSSSPAVRTAMAIGVSSGEVDRSDIKIPYLGITHGVGQLAEKFQRGDIVLGKEHLVAHVNERINIVILSNVKYYKEKIEQDDWQGGKRPRVFFTQKEAIEAGGTVEWETDPDTGRRIAPSFSAAMDMKILIEKPEHLDEGIFGMNLDGKLYAPAYFSVDKSAYNRVGKQVLTSTQLSLAKTGILAGVWELWTENQKINKNLTTVPMIRLASRTSEQFREEVTAMLS